jgi:hypothetical protein
MLFNIGSHHHRFAHACHGETYRLSHRNWAYKEWEKSHENGFSYIELRTQDIKKGLFGRPTSHARSCGICKMGNNLVNRETIRSDFLWPGVSRGEGLIQHRGSPSKLMGQTDMPLIMSNINIAKLRPGCFTIRWFIAIFYSYICWRVK